MHNVPPESFEIAYWPLREVNQTKPVTPALALGFPHAAGDALVDLFESAGQVQCHGSGCAHRGIDTGVSAAPGAIAGHNGPG